MSKELIHSAVLYEYTTGSGERATVSYEVYVVAHYVVRFYNKDGVHMDASDVITDDFRQAMDAADPSDDPMGDYMGRNV